MMKKGSPVIRLVDDDEDLREGLAFMLESEGWKVRCFVGGEDFLARDNPAEPGCAIFDYSMPGMDGLELQRKAAGLQYPHPIIFLTAHADLDMAISAFRSGAVDLLKKPVDNRQLLETVARAVEKDSAAGEDFAEEKKRWDRLTARERQVLKLVLSGLMNYQISERLGLSERTVENHRGNAYGKLGVRTLAELAQFLERIKTAPP